MTLSCRREAFKTPQFTVQIYEQTTGIMTGTISLCGKLIVAVTARRGDEEGDGHNHITVSHCVMVSKEVPRPCICFFFTNRNFIIFDV